MLSSVLCGSHPVVIVLTEYPVRIFQDFFTHCQESQNIEREKNTAQPPSWRISGPFWVRIGVVIARDLEMLKWVRVSVGLCLRGALIAVRMFIIGIAQQCFLARKNEHPDPCKILL